MEKYEYIPDNNEALNVLSLRGDVSHPISPNKQRTLHEKKPAINQWYAGLPFSNL